MSGARTVFLRVQRNPTAASFLDEKPSPASSLNHCGNVFAGQATIDQIASQER